MIISDARNAAQAVSPSDDTRFYDDIGCLARDRAARAKGLRLFVRDGAADGWLPVEQAFFARPAGLETPMGYGITAFASEAAARRADRDGTARHWPDVVREAEAAR
jgi:copper chaperone NosL